MSGVDERHRRMRWRCRRGMRELDALLEGFVDQHFASLDSEDISRLEAILALPDPVLHGYLVRRLEPKDGRDAVLLARIRESLRAQARQVR